MSSSGTQVAVPLPDLVGVVWGAEAVVVVDVAEAVAGLLNRIKGGDNNAKRKRFWKKRLWILQMVSIASEGIGTCGNSISMVLSMVPKRWIHGLLQVITMQARHRYLYYATGIPGWMRFGYSPGWGGMPPGAQYLMTGTWQPAAYPMPADMPAIPAMPAQQEISMLESQAAMLEQQLEQIKKRITELKR